MNLTTRFNALPFLVQAALVTAFYLVAMRLLFGPGMTRPALAATALWAVIRYIVDYVKANRPKLA